MRIALDDTPFEGMSHSFTRMQAKRAWPTCRACGSSLAGRYENTAPRTIAGVRYVVDTFRCGCGCGRQVRRPG